MKQLVALLACLLLASPAFAAAPAQPNIVIMLVDDMGIMDTSVPFLTGADGKPQRYPLNDYYRTPDMERLAARGIRFNNFYCMSVCSPTRISLMTGQNAARHRTTNWINPDNNNAGPAALCDSASASWTAAVLCRFRKPLVNESARGLAHSKT